MTTPPAARRTGQELRGVEEAARSLLDLGRPGAQPAGAVVGLLLDGVESVAAEGLAVLGDGRAQRPMTVDTLIDLASVTKVASTTALTMRLVADDVLRLDEPVATYLPTFAGIGSGVGVGGRHRAAVTVRDLVQHTSGLPPWLPLYCRTTDRGEALAIAAQTPLTRDPGTACTYSDLGMIVLGAVLEAVTGLRQDAALARLVLEPLGLGHTAYGPVPADQAAASADSDVVEHTMVATGDPYPTPHQVHDFDGWRDAPVVGAANDGNAAHALAGVAGHAGLFATIPDLLTLARSLVDPEVVPEGVIREFTRPQRLASDRSLGFALMTATVAGERVPLAVHAGFTGTWLGVALDRDLVVAAAATRLHGTTGSIRRPGTSRDHLVTTTEIAATALDHLDLARQERTGAR